MPEFLLEVGCEELPAGWLPGLSDQLAQRFAEAAVREHLQPAALRSFAAARRLALTAELPALQPARVETVWGPALKLARDAAGNWTKAAEGFARKNGISADQLQIAAKAASPGGKPAQPLQPSEQYVCHSRSVGGRAAADLLPAIIAETLRSLSFPKRMSWDAWLDDGKGSFPFGRPIRWLVALLDTRVVPFVIHAQANGAKGSPILRAGNTSYGHRFFPRGTAGGAVEVSCFAELQAKLRERFVLLEPAEREARIALGLASHTGGAEIRHDHGLRTEWRDLVEHPSVVVGGLPAEFRALPSEVLETVLVHHQKYLPLLDADGRIGRFAAVTDSDGDSAATIVRGMERVVVARLRDAAFFFAEDLKRPLAERLADLEGVTFHEKLGSYRDKAARLVALVEAMGAELEVLGGAEQEAAREAALLCKADLTTLMVREFTELQGVMGGLYLQAQGHPRNQVIAAVRWHYQPVSIEEDGAPAGSLVGADAAVFAALSLADKLDTLAGYFSLGLAPSGSSDPFGLRRAAQGAVRVLLDFWESTAGERRPSLRELVAAALRGYGERLGRPAHEIRSELEAFLFDRLRFVLAARGYPGDEVEAALGAREPDALDDPHEAWVRLRALHAVRSETLEDFEHLAVAFKRAKNILGTAPRARVDPRLFEEEAERELHAAVLRLAQADGGYEARLRSLAGLRTPVDRFFDDVLVMAEDPRLRANRLGLVSEALSLFMRIADISKLGG